MITTYKIKLNIVPSLLILKISCFHFTETDECKWSIHCMVFGAEVHKYMLILISILLYCFKLYTKTQPRHVQSC